MDPSDIAVVKKNHGSTVSRWLDSHDPGSKRTTCGAFLISKRHSFDVCLDLVSDKAQSQKQIDDEAAAKKKKNIHRGSSVAINSGKAKYAPIRSIEKKKNTFESSGVATSLEIMVEGNDKISEKFKGPNGSAKPELKSMPFRFLESFKKRRAKRIDGSKLYALMMNTCIGEEQMGGYDACIKEISVILKQFQQRHATFRYTTTLQEILNEGSGDRSTTLVEITLKQFRKFVNKVFASVIPLSLFGSNKNVKRMCKSLDGYYSAPYEAPICLKAYIHKLDISQIRWLEKIKDPATKCTVIAKIAKWICDRFFRGLFAAMFHRQKGLHDNKRVMMSAEESQRFQRRHIQKQLIDRRVSKVDSDNCYWMNNGPSGSMIIYPKSHGVRPIFRLRSNEDQNERYEMLRIFLQQQYLKKYDFVNAEKFHSIWLTHATMKKKNDDGKMNLVSCDVTDAFGSISLDKLWDILNGMINEIPCEILPLQEYDLILPKRKTRTPTIVNKRWFSCCTEPPFVPCGSLIARSSNQPVEYIKKAYIRAKLHAFIFGFNFKGELYVLVEGIAQGSYLSSILADIYYEHMKCQIFGIFMESGTLLRYVDDFMYITKNEGSAARFLSAINKIVPEYNCHFEKRKIRANIQSPVCQISEWVAYIGYEFNGDTMQVRPVYNHAEFQYLSSSWRIGNSNSLETFARRSEIFAGSKLQRIVLDPKINDVEAIIKSAEVTAISLAHRCVVLISMTFTDPTQYHRSKSSNFQQRTTIVMWQSFVRVFAKYSELREIFSKDMKMIIKKTSCPLAREDPSLTASDSQ